MGGPGKDGIFVKSWDRREAGPEACQITNTSWDFSVGDLEWLSRGQLLERRASKVNRSKDPGRMSRSKVYPQGHGNQPRSSFAVLVSKNRLMMEINH